MKTSEIRRRFVKFFQEKGHTALPSDSLIPPREDKSLLFTGAGMNQFKNEFMGRGTPGLKRAVTSQKCLRTGDIENVGRTAYHHTFFEMLGNFSFGDYFKREAIQYAWEFMLKEMGLPPERLVVSVYEDDDEAYDIWHKEIGLPANKIFRFGQHDNFWPADAPKLGPNGLCGPCSEIFYDCGQGVGCGKPDCDPSCSCPRFCEVWNLVFQQFERKEGGQLDPLPTKNIDTGMGLERMAAVMQGKMSNFDGDLFLPIIEGIQRETGKEYQPVRDTRQGVAFRRIADHIRASVFCINDGILPGNSGRSYVLRKLIRRAVLDGDRLGKKEPFLYRLVPIVGQVMGDEYPDVVQRRENIARLIRIEEERFHQTLAQGQGILEGIIAEMRKGHVDTLPGAEAFRLFDTYGLPLDVTESLLEDEGLKVDTEGYQREMERQRELSRKGTRISADIFGGGPIADMKERGGATNFVGYEKDQCQGSVIGIIVGDELRGDIREGEEAAVILDSTAFYGESGGEVGDSGLLEGEDCLFAVSDSQRSEGMILHLGKVVRGNLRLGDTLASKPDVERRSAIRRNHTATHLLHLALRETIGEHAEQAGSLVAPERLRFDFHHATRLSNEELATIEDCVNARILANTPVDSNVLHIDEARARGAMALFGEKYGETVRMIDIGGQSKELCGGLHCSSTGQIGVFKILSESAVAAGIRRIEAITGTVALRYVRERENLLVEAIRHLAAQGPDVIEKIVALQQENKNLKKDLQKARQSGAPSAADYLKNAKEIGGAKIVSAKLDGVSLDEMRALIDQLRQTAPSVAVVLGASVEERVTLIVAFTKELLDKGLHAGKIAGEAAKIVGGGGGGRPDMAQAGGKDASKLDDAIAKAVDLISSKLNP